MARTYIRDWRGRFARTPGPPKPNRHTAKLKADLIVRRQNLVEQITLQREAHRAPDPLQAREDLERAVFADVVERGGFAVIL